MKRPMIQNNNSNRNNNANNNYNNNPMETEYQRLVAKLVPKLGLPSSVDDDDDEPSAFSQYWIGVAGGPGSGKSTVTTRLAQRLNDIYSQHMSNSHNNRDAVTPSPFPPVAVVIPMDGWHIPQKELISKFGMEGMRRRGAPDTFDAARMIDELTIAKELGMGTFPIYSREISDPVRNAEDPSCCCTLTRDHRIVFVEGLYVLMHEEEDPAWYPLTKLWDDQWYIEAPSRDLQIERLIRRSMKTWSPQKDKLWGPGRTGAQRKVETIDIPNMDWVEQCRKYATEIIVTR